MLSSTAATAPLPPSTMKSDELEGAGPVAGLDYDDDPLRFAVAGSPYHGGAEDARRLIAAVDAALARRAAANVEALEINFVYTSRHNVYISLPPTCWYLFPHRHATDITPARVAAWLGFAERRVTGSFTLALPTLLGPEMRDLPEHKKKRALELPASARAEAMSLSMGYATLTAPAAGASSFHALGDLFLGHAHIEPGGAAERGLGELLSAASCPRLRRLRLEHITGLSALRLDAAATLEELRLDHLNDLASLELDAPGLRSLYVGDCYMMASKGAAARISAPRLETMACSEMCRPDRLEFHGAAAVRSLEKMSLYSHAPDEHWNAGAVGLLRLCTAADSLHVGIMPFETCPFQSNLKENTEEMMSHVPELHNVTNLTIDVHPGFWHKLKATMAVFIAKCSLVECLSISISYANNSCSRPGCLCSQDDDPMFSLEHLREAKITGFNRSSKYHQSLVQLMISGAPILERMTIQLIKATTSPSNAQNNGKELGFNMPRKGQWAPCTSESWNQDHATIYEWILEKKNEDDGNSSDGLILSGF